MSDADFGRAFTALCEDHAAWSRETFGCDLARGPIGPLRHLEKEAREAYENPTDMVEYADCLLLILDASRRAGLTPLRLVEIAAEKLKVVKRRVYPPAAPDEPAEHDRTGEPGQPGGRG
jgi:ParB family chromosome partitioning protein